MKWCKWMQVVKLLSIVSVVMPLAADLFDIMPEVPHKVVAEV